MDQPPHAIKPLKLYGLHNVWLIQRPGEQPRTLKTWPASLWTRLKLLFGIAQPQRQIRGVQLLKRSKIRTPECIGSWRIVRRAPNTLIELELEYAPGISAGELIMKQPVTHLPHLVACAREIGNTVKALAEAGIFHRDIKPSNIIIDQADSLHPVVWIIDTVGVRPMWKRTVEIERMLERLAIQTDRFAPPVLRSMRIACVHAALRDLSSDDRRDVFHRLRQRLGRTR